MLNAEVLAIIMQTQLYNRVSQDAFVRLELYGSKDPRTVLRGPSAGNRAWLPGDCTILTDGDHLDLGIRKASITSESASDERRLA